MLQPGRWEEFDAASLFPPDRIHANKITLRDTDVGSSSDAAKDDKRHHDELTGSASSDPNESDMGVNADKVNDERTSTPPPPQENSEEETPEDATGEGAGNSGEADGDEKSQESSGDTPDPTNPQADGDSQENPDAAGDSSEERSEDASDESGESRNVDANAAGEESRQQNIPGESDGEKPEDSEDGESGQSGSGDSTSPENEDSETGSDSESWEDAVEDSVEMSKDVRPKAKPAEQQSDTERYSGGGDGVDYSGVKHDQGSADVIFHDARDLLKKLLSEDSFDEKIPENVGRFLATTAAKRSAAMAFHRVVSSRYIRPKNNRVVFFVDISGSVSHHATTFMTLIGGVAGHAGVHVVVGSEAHAEAELLFPHPFASVEAALSTIKTRLSTGRYTEHSGTILPATAGWTRRYDQRFEESLNDYLEFKGLNTHDTIIVCFGDMESVGFRTDPLKKLIRKYRFLWLHTRDSNPEHMCSDHRLAVRVGMDIVYGCTGGVGFRNAVRAVASC